MNKLTGDQLIVSENMDSIEIFRYKERSLFQMEDKVGIESSIHVTLKNGDQIDLPCTALHLEELELGIAFSQKTTDESPGNSTLRYARISYDKILECYKEFSRSSPLFKATGSVHSGQLLDANYQILFFTEDMGRHNVIDKIIGFGLKNQIDFSSCTLMISSRMPVELVKKSYKAGIRNIASISAPTREAVSFAKGKNINLLGMFRDNRFNVYSK